MKTIKLPNGTFEYDPAKPLGRRGGFGQVFAGTTASGEAVAIKKLHVPAADAGHRELRIAEEFRRRTFKHVIPFIDSGEDADSGDYFVVMPRAEGSLQARIDSKGVMSAAETAVVLLEITRGLLEVGELVHRDLKPDNILFFQGVWMVADFGIARFTEEVTSGNTLKGFLSDHYAAPEQWRLERATHATDVYALGCVAFCLLQGKPPFIAHPAEEHQKAPVPAFACTDPRLRSLINMMLRKLSETRPVLSRVQDILKEVVSKPQQESGADSLSALASAAAHVADKEQQFQAQEQAKAAAHETRLKLARGGFEILAENVERLWGKIHNHAPNAQRVKSGSIFECRLGAAFLVINLERSNFVGPGAFPHSGWDVVAYSQILVVQQQPKYEWSSSLWFVKLKGASEYRWQEVSYWSMRSHEFEPYAESLGQDADYAASGIFANVHIAFGPRIIDDEHEEDFHQRWIWLLSKAAIGQLSRPRQMPFGWPPPI
jgi:serine/threonine-protein kinase